MRRRWITVAAAISMISCTSSEPGADLPTGAEVIELDPSDFAGEITNRYWPMAPGNRWEYAERDQGKTVRVVVEVTEERRDIAGISATVVHDVVTENGEVIEDTFDWYAQDRDGNLWYLGEDTKEFEHGKVVSTEGSWEHGVDGALAGIAIPADPTPGLTYRQEYSAGEAEDFATVLSVSERLPTSVGATDRADVLLTKDETPLQPELVEYKFYRPDVGPTLVLGISGGNAREELVSFDLAGTPDGASSPGP